MVEATTERDDTGPQGETLFQKEMYFLLHWGLDYAIIDTDDNHRMGVSFTIGVCEHIESGEIRCFRPEELRIIGREIKK